MEMSIDLMNVKKVDLVILCMCMWHSKLYHIVSPPFCIGRVGGRENLIGNSKINYNPTSHVPKSTPFKHVTKCCFSFYIVYIQIHLFFMKVACL